MSTLTDTPAVLPQQYDLAVLIGRFQPFHEGHESVVRQALTHAKNVLVLCGSAYSPRSHRNPFTYAEREEMVFTSCPNPQVFCAPLEDALYNDHQWLLNVQTAINECLKHIADQTGNTRKNMRVTLIGHSKDHSSYYLNMFPAYDSIEAPNFQGVSSTPMRNAYFSNIFDMWLQDCDGHRPGDKQSEHLVTPAVRNFLINFRNSTAYADIREEYEFILNYRANWKSAPFPVTMVTTDALVIQSGNVLLIRRKARPGKGLWALPGGYLKQNELIEDGMIRELVEETKIGLSISELKKNIVASRVFDDPNRDPRGRIITHAYRIDLPPRRTLQSITKKKIKNEDVEGADDAEFAKWFSFSEIKREMLYADHYDIIRVMGGIN